MDPSPGHHPPYFLYHIQALVMGVWFMWGLSTDVPLPLLFKPKVELKILMETGVTSPQPAPGRLPAVRPEGFHISSPGSWYPVFTLTSVTS